MLGVWIGLAIMFALVELATPQLVSIWFCIAALCTLLAMALGAELWLQIVVFAISSILLLALTRPLYKKFLKPKLIKTNTDALIGEDGVVTIEINNDEAAGQVKIKGQIWSALSSNGSVIAVGQKVVVESLAGVKLIVAPKANPTKSEKDEYITPKL